jgi:hypothetical protein
MSASHQPPRRFSDAETQDVLRRAAALHEVSSPTAGDAGLDQRELERIAAEIGIGPATLRRAIVESDVQASDPGPQGSSLHHEGKFGPKH